MVGIEHILQRQTQTQTQSPKLLWILKNEMNILFELNIVVSLNEMIERNRML